MSLPFPFLLNRPMEMKMTPEFSVIENDSRATTPKDNNAKTCIDLIAKQVRIISLKKGTEQSSSLLTLMTSFQGKPDFYEDDTIFIQTMYHFKKHSEQLQQLDCNRRHS
ncbi:hypothetical protein NPIL_547461 [Nephila pilipes]|uniref:Uncharacterized protein n=1 Tax=Nephila pilipes TaxID=299642 RepID=A0A8X6PZU2_NEPPI|nr:hypothetical protein NPIL_547461 [Nephila pilipes]